MKSQNNGLAGIILSLSLRWSCFTPAALLLLACGNPLFARAQSDCNLVFDAGYRVTATPHHGYRTYTMQITGGKQQNAEDIVVGDTIYVQSRGKWRKSPMTVQQMQKQEQENRKGAKNVSCRHLRDEAVNGEAAGVFSAHSETEDVKADSVVWISKSRGLILRQEEDTDSEGGKSHVSARFEYNNISAPTVSP